MAVWEDIFIRISSDKNKIFSNGIFGIKDQDIIIKDFKNQLPNHQ